MIVSMWMTRDPLTIGPRTPLAEAAAIMAARHIRRLPVVEEHAGESRAIGIISASDILRAAPTGVNPFAIAHTAPVPGNAEDVMKRNLVSIATDAPIEQAAALMRKHKIGAMPVTSGTRLAGIITESDVFGAFASLFEGAHGGVRITFDTSQGEDTFALLARLTPPHGVRVESLFQAIQNATPVCVARLTGAHIDALMEDLWNSGHRVLNVVHL
jgi:acetoin utilization protein AcuB